MNLAVVAKLVQQFPDLDFILAESGGDNLGSTFSPELAVILLKRVYPFFRMADPLCSPFYRRADDLADRYADRHFEAPAF